MMAFKTKQVKSNKKFTGRKRSQISQVSRKTEEHLHDRPALVRRFLYIGLSLVFLIALVWQAVGLLAPAEIEIEIPARDVITSMRDFVIEGNVEPGSSLTLNEEVVLTDELGRFMREVFLQPGVNTFVFEVKKRYSKSKVEVRNVYFEEEKMN